MPESQKIEKPEWWSQKLTSADVQNAQKALVEHIIEEDLLKSEVADNVDLAKAVLPQMANLDAKWKKVKSRYFNIKDFKAHEEFYHNIRNLVNSKKKLNNLLLEKKLHLFQRSR